MVGERRLLSPAVGRTKAAPSLARVRPHEPRQESGQKQIYHHYAKNKRMYYLVYTCICISCVQANKNLPDPGRKIGVTAITAKQRGTFTKNIQPTRESR